MKIHDKLRSANKNKKYDHLRNPIYHKHATHNSNRFSGNCYSFHWLVLIEHEISDVKNSLDGDINIDTG